MSTSRSFCTCLAPRVLPKPQRLSQPRSSILNIPTYKNKRPVPAGQPTTELFQLCHVIPAVVHRPTLINEDSARDMVRAWGLDKMHDLVVVEPYAGAYLRALGAGEVVLMSGDYGRTGWINASVVGIEECKESDCD